MRTAPGYIWKIDAEGVVQYWTDLADATFVNGCTVHPNGRDLLVCESRSSRILAIDMTKAGKWSTWLEDDWIGPGESPYPGANGIKIRDGWAWVTISGRMLIVRVPILADGSPGSVELAFPEVLGDDFTFGASGALYVTTHPAQTVICASIHRAPGRRSRDRPKGSWAQRPARSERRPATSMRSMSRQTVASSFRTRMSCRMPSSFGSKSAKPAGLSWVTAEPRPYPMRQQLSCRIGP